jgi:hypothetical protein
MRTRDRIVLISLIVVSSATTAWGVNYIRADTIARRETVGAGNGNDANGQRLDIGDVEPQREQAPPRVALTTREKKTFAVLLLMLRDGRGAR